MAVELATVAALLLAVGIVVVIDRRTQPAAAPPALETITEDQGPQKPLPKPLRIAITPDRPGFDDMGRLLDSLGDGYAYRLLPLDHLLDISRIGQFDILFLTCSGYTDTWLGKPSDEKLRGGDVYEPNPDTFDRAKQSLRKFVADGGTLYASDLHLLTVQACFPEFYDQSLDCKGAKQKLNADVLDPALQQLIGDHIELTFDQEGWKPAALAGEGLTVYLTGNFKTVDGGSRTAPLLVRFPFGTGSVVFTSFHNEKQNSEKEKDLLRFLVFAVVTAATDDAAARTLARGGFARTRKDLFSASHKSDPISRTFDNAMKADLQFVLAFADQAAELELEVEGPEGVVQRKRGRSTLTVDVPSASAGSWKYTIRPIDVPSDHFPFTISVGRRP